MRSGDTCRAPLDACGDAAIPKPGGGCSAVGVAACAEGFASDKEGGCNSILPESCGPGTLALPGETVCHELSPCGEGTFGNIPVDAKSIYVDRTSTAPPNGTRESPYTTIQAALDAAPDDALIAIAEGIYPESVSITKRVRLWGRCPAKVEIAAATTMSIEAPGELHALSIRGVDAAITITSVIGLRLDKLWLHHSRRGLIVQSRLRPTDVTLTNSLVESIDLVGIDVAGSKLVIDRSVVRDVVPTVEEAAVGVLSQYNGFNEAGGDVTMKRSVVERVGGIGVDAIGSKLGVDVSVIRDLLPSKSGQGGIGVVADDEVMRKIRSTLTITDSVVERARSTGISLSGAVARIERSTIRATQPVTKSGIGGFGITALDNSDLTLLDSVVRDSRTAGISVTLGTITVERCIVRDTREQLSDNAGGLGILAIVDDRKRVAPIVTVTSTLILRSRSAGILFHGAEGSITSSAIRDTEPQLLGGLFGDGIYISAAGAEPIPANVVVSDTSVERSARAGILVQGASAKVSGALLLCNAFDLEAGRWFETSAAGDKLETEFTLEDGGNNGCGCAPTTRPCRAQSSGLEPIPTPRVR